MILSLVSWAAVYFVVWWTTLFVVLPFGVKSQVEEGAIVPGSEPGAPARTSVPRIVLITTVAATIAFALLYWILTQRLIGLDDIPFLPRFERVG